MIDDPLGLEQLERIAQRRHRDAEHLDQLALRQKGARRDLPLEQRFEDARVGQIAQGASAAAWRSLRVFLLRAATCFTSASEISRYVSLTYQMQSISNMRIVEFRITRFQFARDRVIGDSQVRIDAVHIAALELIAEDGEVGLGFVQSLFHPLPDQAEIVRVFEEEAWPGLVGQSPLALVHRVEPAARRKPARLRLPFDEALQVALWDLAPSRSACRCTSCSAAAATGCRAYASGLDFHLSDDEFQALLRPCRRARLPRLQDQGRAPRFRPGPVPAGAAEKDRAPGRVDHDRCQRGLGRQGGAGKTAENPKPWL